MTTTAILGACAKLRSWSSIEMPLVAIMGQRLVSVKGSNRIPIRTSTKEQPRQDREADRHEQKKDGSGRIRRARYDATLQEGKGPDVQRSSSRSGVGYDRQVCRTQTALGLDIVKWNRRDYSRQAAVNLSNAGQLTERFGQKTLWLRRGSQPMLPIALAMAATTTNAMRGPSTFAATSNHCLNNALNVRKNNAVRKPKHNTCPVSRKRAQTR